MKAEYCVLYADHVITLTLHNAKLFSIVGTSFSENSKREDSLASHEEGNASYAIQFYRINNNNNNNDTTTTNNIINNNKGNLFSNHLKCVILLINGSVLI